MGVGDIDLMEVEGGTVDYRELTRSEYTAFSLGTIIIEEVPVMDDDDSLKTGLEPSLTGWFWPVALVIAVIVALAIAYG